ncbi:LysM peptidoglycan-binding domain-containing protein [Promicromonospora soli]
MTATAIRPAPTARDRVRGLLAVLGIGAIVAGLPGLLLAAQHTFWPPDLSWATAQLVLANPDGTGLIVGAIVVGWVLWAWLTVAVVAQVAAVVRDVRLPRVPGLPQDWARHLVAAASLVFVTVPTAQALTPEAAVAAVAPLHPEPTAAQPGPADGGDQSTNPAARDGAGMVTTPQTRPYTVKPNDTLWALAHDHLGDGTRWHEIFNLDANRKVLGAKPDFLPTGVVLRLPVDTETSTNGPNAASDPVRAAPAEPADMVTHVVQPSDTLWSVAAERLNDPHRYPEIVQASSETIQPGGDRLVDPDHIEPGWTLTIPPTATTAPADANVKSASPPPVTPEPERATSDPDQPAHHETKGPVASPAPSTTTPSPAPSTLPTSPSTSPDSPTRPGAVTPWTLPTNPTPDGPTQPSATANDTPSSSPPSARTQPRPRETRAPAMTPLAPTPTPRQMPARTRARRSPAPISSPG